MNSPIILDMVYISSDLLCMADVCDIFLINMGDERLKDNH